MACVSIIVLPYSHRKPDALLLRDIRTSKRDNDGEGRIETCHAIGILVESVPCISKGHLLGGESKERRVAMLIMSGSFSMSAFAGDFFCLQVLIPMRGIGH